MAVRPLKQKPCIFGGRKERGKLEKIKFAQRSSSRNRTKERNMRVPGLLPKENRRLVLMKKEPLEASVFPVTGL